MRYGSAIATGWLPGGADERSAPDNAVECCRLPGRPGIPEGDGPFLSHQARARNERCFVIMDQSEGAPIRREERGARVVLLKRVPHPQAAEVPQAIVGLRDLSLLLGEQQGSGGREGDRDFSVQGVVSPRLLQGGRVRLPAHGPEHHLIGLPVGVVGRQPLPVG